MRAWWLFGRNIGGKRAFCIETHARRDHHQGVESNWVSGVLSETAHSLTGLCSGGNGVQAFDPGWIRSEGQGGNGWRPLSSD